jgi:hypothetical protein
MTASACGQSSSRQHDFRRPIAAVRRLIPVVAGVGIAGCGPSSIVPGPTLSWWLVFSIIGGFILYTYLQQRK